MNKFVIEITTENDAYEYPNYLLEIESNLKAVIAKLQKQQEHGYIYDTNGNRVGSFEALDVNEE